TRSWRRLAAGTQNPGVPRSRTWSGSRSSVGQTQQGGRDLVTALGGAGDDEDGVITCDVAQNGVEVSVVDGRGQVLCRTGWGTDDDHVRGGLGRDQQVLGQAGEPRTGDLAQVEGVGAGALQALAPFPWHDVGQV